ncbi:hypothetical protein [Novilysobacter spongiicola]|uniref:Uncharacterized protein n=1 Tax=Lysobacter spongiicola DSM 21749 TaxID=1122188 RepID=A0A1T4P3W0_9GAMM|nr:hypothetical protein [Lysobacter spongiicola]SJZ86139.1 hypothetical protein SAMN02745674_01065 [Lysobacter spongiicola DSM 21749]
MTHSNWRRGAFVVATVSIVAAGAFFVRAPAHIPDAPDTERPRDAGDPVASEVGSSGSRSRANGGTTDATAPGAGAPPIPEGLPPVDPVDPPEYATGLAPDTLYVPDPEVKAHFAGKLPFGVDDRTYVEFNRRALSDLAVGSRLTLRTPDDGKIHTIRVDDVQVHPNGDKSWFGHVLDVDGDSLPAVFTQGADSSFGNISTSSGTYSLEAEGRMGWIANVNTLRRHQDFDQPDVLVPDPADSAAPPGGY